MSIHLYCPLCGKPPHGSAACQAAPGWPTQEASDVVTTARIIDGLRKRIADLEHDNRNLHGLNDTLRKAVAESEAELAALIPVAGSCPECGIDPAELAALRYQLDLACVDIACLVDEPDRRAGSSDAVHEDLHRRWCSPREEMP
jgi:rubredoxin